MATLDSLPLEILSFILASFCVHCCDPHQKVPATFFHIGTTAEQQRQEGQQRHEEKQDGRLPVGNFLGRQALYSMCLVSTKFRDLAQPILYHVLVPRSTNGRVWSRCLTAFLRTVVRRPDLAALVRRIVFGINLGVIRDGDARLVLEEATRARGTQLADFLRSFWESYPRGDLEEMRLANCDQLTVMLLASLPNLTSVVFSNGLLVPNIPKSALRATGVLTLPLQTVEIFGGMGDRIVVLSDLLNIASSTLSTINVASGGFGLLGTLASYLPGLRNLCITNSNLRDWGLGVILSRCEALESFIFEAGTFPICH